MKRFCKLSIKDKKLAKKKAVRKWFKEVEAMLNSEEGRKLIMKTLREGLREKGLS